MLGFFAYLERICIPAQAELRVYCAIGSLNCGMKRVGLFHRGFSIVEYNGIILLKVLTMVCSVIF